MIHTKFSDPICLWDVKTSLGEGVVWVEREQSVYFVDILRNKIYRYTPETKTKTEWDTPLHPTFVFPTDGELMLCGMSDGLYWFDPVHGTLEQWFVLNENHLNNRLNDGYIDSLGRLWFGTMDSNEQEPNGTLYLLECDSDGNVSAIPKDTNYVVTNGPVIDQDNLVFYHNHSNEKMMFKFDWDKSGVITNKQVFAHVNDGYPDGMAGDTENNIWVCLYAGQGINIYSKNGTFIDKVSIPSSNVTKIAFGGKDSKTAFVTTALQGMSDQEKKIYPLAGGLFSFEVEIAGQRQNVFKTPKKSSSKQ